MTIRVNLIENGRFAEILSDGHVTRREAGWATERVREMVEAGEVAAILADSTDTERQVSPLLSGELIESFLLAIGTSVPVAYVCPTRWTETYFACVRDHVGELPDSAGYFAGRAEALDWLRAQSCADAC
ncbi:MAG: hypothetical protein CMH94_01195 [Oceanicaulis sp.]|nr:hypothetical protein [Oceanicaulis sp.]MAZ91117.1 hypothetical protein [Maricaulis sp.]MBI74205.1 hypothetical protein [Oceanicaulis sp.]|tara:strand:- start:574 stop:960 length:387 start_codon:yes stop_codon:yes gene_type:complete